MVTRTAPETHSQEVSTKSHDFIDMDFATVLKEVCIFLSAGWW